jgi:8-oxo-dGTP diphosphatase
MYKKPSLSVDVIVTDGERVVLIKRGRDPFKGSWAIPGGFVEYRETVENAAIRELSEETGLYAELVDILGVYSSPDRDPRGHTISTVFIAQYSKGEPRGADDADEASWFKISEVKPDNLAFDHGLILSDFKRYLQKRGSFWSARNRRV